MAGITASAGAWQGRGLGTKASTGAGTGDGTGARTGASAGASACLVAPAVGGERSELEVLKAMAGSEVLARFRQQRRRLQLRGQRASRAGAEVIAGQSE